MILMSQKVLFADFRDALSFLNTIRIGKIQRRPDALGYLWDSESSVLTEEQATLVEEADGSRFVWFDSETGLTWLLRKHIRSLERNLLNARNYGGHDDWRTPSLRELKTLSSSKKNTLGVYVKEELEGRISGNYKSCTQHYHWQDSAWWNFDQNKATKEEYSEGKIKWGSEGEYAGFEPDRYHNSAGLILVRGADTQSLSDWALTLRDWAESDNVFNFPATQKNMEELESLSLFMAKRLPAEISKLARFKQLTCYSCAGFEQALFSITSLEELELCRPYHSVPCMDEIPSAVQNLRQIVSLKASLLGLKRVHEAIGTLERLQHLDLSYNKIEVIPDSIGNLSRLKTLHLGQNPMRSIPASIGNISGLESSSIGGEFLEALPDSIGNLKYLRKLIIRSKIKQLPKSICYLSRLESFICYAPINNLPDDFFLLKNLTSIKIESNDFYDFPSVLFKMPWLKTIKIKGININTIPVEILLITELEHLDLSETKISHLPESLQCLKKLRFFRIFRGH